MYRTYQSSMLLLSFMLSTGSCLMLRPLAPNKLVANKLLSQSTVPQAASSAPTVQELKAKKMEELYKQTEVDVAQAFDNFAQQLQAKIDGSAQYSKKQAQEFVTFLNQLVDGFAYQMRAEKTMMVVAYFSFIKSQDLDYVYNYQLSPDERIFIEGVSHIIQEAMVRVQGLALDVTSKNLSTTLGTDLEHRFYRSSLDAERSYERQKKQNAQKLDRSWWDTLKKDDNTFISKFSKNFMKAIKKEVEHQVTTAAIDFGGQIVGTFGKSAINLIGQNISPEMVTKIELLSSLLKGEKFFSLLNDHSNVALIALRKAICTKYPVRNAKKPIQVVSSIGLCAEEKNYLKNRSQKVQKVLQEHFGISQPLKIAFCCSGGGNRAMVGTLGLSMAASRHNFLQAATYWAGLSGSTWIIAPWSYLYLKGLVNKKSYENSFVDLKNSYIQVLDNSDMAKIPKRDTYCPAGLSDDVKKVFSDQLMTRFGYDQHVSYTDIWGALIGNYALKLIGKSRLEVCWSDLYDLAQKGDIPLPLCSAAFDGRSGIPGNLQRTVGDLYDWLETGPFEAGSTVLGYIPMRYLGSEFSNGNLVQERLIHEYPLSYWLGVYGSAFSLSLNDIIEKGLPSPKVDVFGYGVSIPVPTWVKHIIKETYGAQSINARADYNHTIIPNFSAGMKNSLLKNKETIDLFDGGIAFNIPLPLLTDRPERRVDVIIIYDSNPGDGSELKTADAYYKRKKISMPTMGNLSKSDLLSRPMTVFNDPREPRKYNAKQPTILYFPTNVDVKTYPYVTSNFRYTKETIQKLVDIVDDAFESQVPDMKEILYAVSKARYPSRRDS